MVLISLFGRVKMTRRWNIRKYGSAELYGNILKGLRAAGLDPGSADIKSDDLKAVDEFHIGGVVATEHLVSQLNLDESARVVDLGSGLGGTARYICSHYPQVSVTGIDITPQFVETARKLTNLVSMNEDGRINFVEGSVMNLSEVEASFDAATMLHVGMNIEQKAQIFKSAFSALKPGGKFAIYDVMLEPRADKADLRYPLPWAAHEDTSFVGTKEDYIIAATEAGFEIEVSNDRSDFAKAFFKPVKKRLATNSMPLLSLIITFGDDAIAKMENVIEMVDTGVIAPQELIFLKP